MSQLTILLLFVTPAIVIPGVILAVVLAALTLEKDRRELDSVLTSRKPKTSGNKIAK
jgi:hypothetical protein